MPPNAPAPSRLAARLGLPLAAALLLAPASAHAEAAESALTLGPLLRGLTETAPGAEAAFRPAFGLEARYRYGLDDFFQVGLALDLDLTTDPAFVGALAAEVHYVIDIVTWVPYVSLGLGALVRDAVPTSADTTSAPRADLLATLGGGLEYRPARDYAFDLHGRYELVLTDFDRSSSFSVVLGYTLFFE